jgi:hypothetical protein
MNREGVPGGFVMAVLRRTFLCVTPLLPLAFAAPLVQSIPLASSSPPATFPAHDPEVAREMVSVSHGNVARVVFGSGTADRLTVTVGDRGPSIQREGAAQRNLFHLGGRVFHPSGADAVRIRFESGQAAPTVTVEDGPWWSPPDGLLASEICCDIRGFRLPPSPRLRRTAVALAEAVRRKIFRQKPGATCLWRGRSPTGL